MTITIGPFDSGVGAQFFTSAWSKMFRQVMPDGPFAGYLNELLVYADSTGMQIKVKSGGALLKGHLYDSDAEQVLAVTSAHATLARIDLVVLEVDWSLSDTQMAIKVIAGTPAGSPAAPALVQTTTKWQITLATVQVDAAVVTIAAGKVTDLRTYSTKVFSLPLIIGSGQAVPSTGVLPVGVPLPYKCKIIKWELVANASGSIQVDLWKASYANYPPTVSNTIISTGKPILSSAQKATAIPTDTTWPGRTFAAGDYLLGNIDSVATIKQVCLTLYLAALPY